MVRRIWPPILRILERLKFHRSRQEYLLGYIARGFSLKDLQLVLQQNGFEPAVLAWKDPGEILSMRKRDGKRFQYHLRLFSDGEIRGHHEYASEANPILHSIEKDFTSATEFFESLLGDLLVSYPPSSKTIGQ